MKNRNRNSKFGIFSAIGGMLLFFFSASPLAAQNEDLPWAVSVGWNVVDFYPNGEGFSLGWDSKPFSEEIFSEFFNGDYYNFDPLALRVAVGKSLWPTVFAEVATSFNKISKYGTLSTDDLRYITLDASLNYSFRNLLNPTGWAEPFVAIGAGLIWVEEDRTRDLLGTGSTDLGVGLGIWLSRRLSLVLRSTFKKVWYEHEIKDFTDSNFQHSLSLKYSFYFGEYKCYDFK